MTPVAACLTDRYDPSARARTRGPHRRWVQRAGVLTPGGPMNQRRRSLVFALLLALAAGGCGARVDRENVGAPAQGQHLPSTAAQPIGDTVASNAYLPDSETHETTLKTSPAAVTGERTRAGGGGVAKVEVSEMSADSPEPPTVGAGSASVASPRPVLRSGPDQPEELRPSPGKSPALVASVGTHTGPVGANMKSIVQGSLLWVQHINQQGGLNGHVVRMLLFDDGGDPARHRAQVQEAIERYRVIAFLSNVEPLSGEGSLKYITNKRVPVLGMSGAEDWAYSSPMYFPSFATGPALYLTFAASVAQQMVPKGKTKVGTLVCVEAAGCATVEQVFSDSARRLGYLHIYRGRSSLAQPDFTAECLAARNAGVEVLWITLDTNSVRRVHTACSRQGYTPVLAIPGQAVIDSMKDDEGFAGTIAPSSVFPYFASGTPAADEFRTVMRAHGMDLSGVGAALGWVSGKMLEKAGANLPEPPTSDAILAGLWSLKDDTLGGLTEPLTFVKDQPAPQRACWFNLVIENRSWISPDQGRVNCA